MTRIIPALFALLFCVSGAFAAAPHSGVVERDGFAPSDVALFVVAALGVWLARRALRARFRKRSNADRD
ncbi:hypothetical protein [Stakelama marina]|uniref:Uncharacterized protein n=1 Tax=Stakelama marina TaxID=2826939 RepID=A0A8T4IIB3_9SPHN|nr:hypothetical protein [Stakelama marina]MBR0553624.1 hypothetical protein [Stakelama marina]